MKLHESHFAEGQSEQFKEEKKKTEKIKLLDDGLKLIQTTWR